MVAAETIEPAKPKYLLSGPLQKKVTDPGLNMIEVYFSIMGSPAGGREYFCSTESLRDQWGQWKLCHLQHVTSKLTPTLTSGKPRGGGVEDDGKVL